MEASDVYQAKIPGKVDILALKTIASKGYGCMSCPMGGVKSQTGPAAYITVAGYEGIPSYEQFKNENIYL
jgi:hypothetical protein